MGSAYFVEMNEITRIEHESMSAISQDHLELSKRHHYNLAMKLSMWVN